MRKIIHKVFFVWNFDKEEQWLNEMAAKGLCLVSVGFCKYEFEDCVPGEYRICMQLLDQMPSHPESQKYIEFLEQTGAEQIGSFTRWVFFRKKASGGDFQLFSDNSSKVKHLTAITNMVTFVIGFNLFVGLYNLLMLFFFGNPLIYMGYLNLIIGIWGLYGTIKLWKKRNRMKKESQLFES